MLSLYRETLKAKGKYEVFFPEVFTFNQPWGFDDYRLHLPPKYQLLQQPRLCLNFKAVEHVTHYINLQDIYNGFRFTFKANPKRGDKNYSYVNDDKDPTLFHSIDKAINVICDGYFSWWSIKVIENPYDVSIMKTYEQLEMIPRASFLFDEGSSMYGTVKITMNFDRLIYYYAESIAPNQKEKVRYKVGGTLRYQKEVCYVIIVCVFKDGKDPLPDFPTLNDLSNLVIRQPYNYFIIRDRDNISVSWDHYVFALYFPPNDDPKEQPSFTVDPYAVNITGVEHRYYKANGSYKAGKPKPCHLINRNHDIIECPDYEKFIKQGIPLTEFIEKLDTTKINLVHGSQSDDSQSSGQSGDQIKTEKKRKRDEV